MLLTPIPILMPPIQRLALQECQRRENNPKYAIIASVYLHNALTVIPFSSAHDFSARSFLERGTEIPRPLDPSLIIHVSPQDIAAQDDTHYFRKSNGVLRTTK
jgi:hypothetical protein